MFMLESSNIILLNDNGQESMLMNCGSFKDIKFDLVIMSRTSTSILLGTLSIVHDAHQGVDKQLLYTSYV